VKSLILAILIFSNVCQAWETNNDKLSGQFETADLVCSNGSNGLACVSKASIDKDRKMIESLKIQDEYYKMMIDEIKSKKSLELEKASKKAKVLK